MPNCGTILLISGNPDLHGVLETLSSSYSLSLLCAENIKQGLTLFKENNPDCVVFDLRLPPPHVPVEQIKEKMRESEVPILFLSNCIEELRRADEVPSRLSLEPIMKFVANQSERLRSDSSGRLWSRLLGRARVGHA